MRGVWCCIEESDMCKNLHKGKKVVTNVHVFGTVDNLALTVSEVRKSAIERESENM